MTEQLSTELERGQIGAGSQIEFVLPPELEARRPAELRGQRRDRVRLMVLPRFQGEITHTRFDELEKYMHPGDLLVVNNSRTLPALLPAQDERGRKMDLRLAGRRSEDTWDALISDGHDNTLGPDANLAGTKLTFGEGLSAVVLAPSPDSPFLWQVQFSRCCMTLLDLIYRLGEPVRYSYIDGALPLDLYQTVYASEPGSVEMPSAGRPFTWELLLRLQRRGVGLAAITLHTGLSSSRDEAADKNHPIHPEAFSVPEATAQAVNLTRARGKRVIAVGTSVVRTLETVANEHGSVPASDGVTHLKVTAQHRLRAVDGLLTGMHEPQASHLDLLSAFVRPDRLQAAYREAVRRGYLWHEFGDVNLIV